MHIKKNILKRSESKGKDYKLVIFVEDATKSGYIVRKRKSQPINPLLLKQIAETILEYKDEVWGIIYAYGNEISNNIVAYTLKELETKMEHGELHDANDFEPFEAERKVHVNKSGKANETADSNNLIMYSEYNEPDEVADTNEIIINLFDHI